MYCFRCNELVKGRPVVDDEGFEWPYDLQLCQECRPADTVAPKRMIEMYLRYQGVSYEEASDRIGQS